MFFRKNASQRLKKAVVDVDSTRKCRRNTRKLAVVTRKCYLLHVHVRTCRCKLSKVVHSMGLV